MTGAQSCGCVGPNGGGVSRPRLFSALPWRPLALPNSDAQRRPYFSQSLPRQRTDRDMTNVPSHAHAPQAAMEEWERMKMGKDFHFGKSRLAKLTNFKSSTPGRPESPRSPRSPRPRTPQPVQISFDASPLCLLRQPRSSILTVASLICNGFRVQVPLDATSQH